MAQVKDCGDVGRLVRLARAGKHLTQLELAARAGVSRSTIADLEGGENISMRVALKVLSCLGMDLEVASPEPELLWTADKAARAVRRELRNGDRDFAMRTIIQASSYFDRLNLAERTAFLVPPPSTGRKRWDTFLARTFAYKCRQHHMKEPSWTQAAPLESTWYATPRSNVSPAWKKRMAEHTPGEFAEANIKFDARSLVTA